jgi:hypothetical protein
MNNARQKSGWIGFGRLLCLAALLGCGGCQLMEALFHRGTAAADVPAQYVPPKEPMLVLVENYHTSGDVETDASHLSIALIQTLKAYKVAPIVDSLKLEQLRDKDQDAYDKMKVDAIGAALGAKQVLYVNVTRAQIESPTGSDSVRGTMAARVRVVDCATGETQWPADSKVGELVAVQTTWEQNKTDKVRTAVRGEMADQMAEKIGGLFHVSKDTETHPLENAQ